MEQSPDQEASAKLAQHLAVAVQVAESVIRLRQRTTEGEQQRDRAAAGAARAERAAQHAADRLVWSPALDRDWLDKADLHDLGRAWGSASGWADADPTADAAARRVETRLSDLAPNAMARFDELRETGWTRADAMADVLASVTHETHAGDSRRVFVADAGPASADSAGSADASSADASSADAFAHRRRVTDNGVLHPADVAADSHPTPFTEVTKPAARALPPAAATPAAARTRTLSR